MKRFILFCCLWVGAEVESQPQIQPATVEGSVHTISLPNYTPDMPQGPNLSLFNNQCTVCHSARYVLMQPDFSRKLWTAEVNKMSKAFGCPVKQSDVEPLVDYLMSIRGGPQN